MPTRARPRSRSRHAATAHVYRPDLESSRISIKMRAGSLGHHHVFEKRSASAVPEQDVRRADLVVGAMAAEFAFYGENSNGVGGDLQSTTWVAANMVGAAGMSPLPIDLHGKTFADENEEQSAARVMKRFEDIGLRLLNRQSGGMMTGTRLGGPERPRKRMYAASWSARHSSSGLRQCSASASRSDRDDPRTRDALIEMCGSSRRRITADCSTGFVSPE